MRATEQPNSTIPEACAELERLRRRVFPGKRPSYHAFEHRGTRLVYDLLTGTLLETNELAFRILRAIELRTPPEELAAVLADIPVENVLGVASDISDLYDVGLMRTEPDYSETLKRRVVADLVDHKPRKMMLMVQSNCNLKCTYCYEVLSGFHATGKRMDFETGRMSVEFLIRRSGSRRDLEVTFFGGEPLMNFELIRELVDYCRTREPETGKRFAFQLTTNCTLLDDERIRYLVENEFAVMVSLDGPPELHDIHRVGLGGEGTGAKALDLAKRLVAAQKAAGIRESMVRVTMTHENHDSRKLNEYFTGQGFGRVMIGASDGRVDRKDSWDLGSEDVDELHEQSQESLDDYLRWIDGRGPRPADAGSIARNLDPILQALQTPDPMPKIRCGVARNMQAITRDGKVYPCHRYAGEDKFQLGTLENGLDPARVQSYYESLVKVKEEHCSNCWARITCGGQCPWYISKQSGEIAHPDEESCNGIRRGHERMLWFVHELTRRGRLADLRAQVAAETVEG